MADQQAGWYPDPSGDASKLRYWDGMKWTNDFTDAGAGAVSQPAQPVQPVQTVQTAQPVYPTQAPQPAQPYQQTQFYGQVPPTTQAPVAQSNNMAVAALICGIVGLCIGPASVVALILGIIARKNPDKKGMATAGLVLGIVGVIGWIVALIILFAL